MNLLEKLNGSKTYAFSVVLILLAGLDLAGLVPTDTKTALYGLLISAIAASLRHGMSKLPAETLAKVERARQLLKTIKENTKPSPVDGADSLDVARDPVVPPYYTTALLLPLLLLPACAEAQSPITPSRAPLLATAGQFPEGSPAKPPRAIIQGPSHVIPGELIVLDASQSDGAENFRWSISPELKGRKQLIEMDGGKRCQIASYGGRYVVTLAVSNAAGIDLLTWEIKVDGNAPCPPPDPQPIDPVEPDPIKPEPVKPVDPPPSPMPQPVDPVPAPIQPPAAGEFGIAPKVFDLAKAAKSPTRVADCQMLASECKRIAASDWANLNAIASEIVSVLKKLPAGWEDLAKSVQTAIAELYQGGKIKNTGDIKRLLLEVAAAFELAGKVK